MDRVIHDAGTKARQELEQVRQRAEDEGWDLEKIEREKWKVALKHDVTICSTPGCLHLASAVPGFRDLVRCGGCESSKR